MNTRLLFVSVAVFCWHSRVTAQESLPYSTGFETQAERDAWEEYRLGATAFYNWGFTTMPTAYVSHDYPVGAGSTDTTQDWLVSPEIHFHSTSKLSLSMNIFTMIGTTEADRFEVWLSTGEKDPAGGDYELIADFTDLGGSGAWQDTAEIALPDTGMGYLAFVYQATNNWFTVAIDSIEITPDVPLSVAEAKNPETRWYFLPAQNSLHVSHAQKEDVIVLYDLRGTVLREVRARVETCTLDLSGLRTPIVLVACYRNGEKIKSEKLIIQP